MSSLAFGIIFLLTIHVDNTYLAFKDICMYGDFDRTWCGHIRIDIGWDACLECSF